MKEELVHRVRESGSPEAGRNVMREMLQARILASLQRAGAMIPLAFHGGTALRFLYAIRRYSEDLDFALERSDRGYDFRTYLNRLQTELKREGYPTALKVNDRKVVHSAFVRFPGLPYELGLSNQAKEVFAIKIEIDTNPPAGAVLATTIVRRHFTLQLQHHDRGSMLAGKIHAILQRSYTKGRDLYDLMWYLGDRSWPAPNLEMLNNALRQSEWTGAELTAGTWRRELSERLQALDWARAVTDVRPFLESPEESSLLTRENLLQLLE